MTSEERDALVEEKKAKDQAKREGKDPEEARKAVLNDPNLYDAELSEEGKRMAVEASSEIAELVAEKGFKPPTLVFTSPLMRTLQTTSLVFPKHKNIRVREELRERRTGYAADERQAASRMFAMFGWMNFAQVPARRASVVKVDEARCTAGDDTRVDALSVESIGLSVTTPEDSDPPTAVMAGRHPTEVPAPPPPVTPQSSRSLTPLVSPNNITTFDSSLNDEVTRVLDMCNNTLSGLPNPSTEVTNTLNEINTLKQRLGELKVKPSPVTRRPSLTDMIFKRFANTDTPSTSIVKEEKEGDEVE